MSVLVFVVLTVRQLFSQQTKRFAVIVAYDELWSTLAHSRMKGGSEKDKSDISNEAWNKEELRGATKRCVACD